MSFLDRFGYRGLEVNGVTQQFSIDFREDNFNTLGNLIRDFVMPDMRYKIDIVPRNMAGIDNMNLAIDVSHLKARMHWLDFER